MTTELQFDRRFDRMSRLIGDTKMKRLIESHVVIIGLGGVGSWAAESIARSGVGRLTLIDFDQVCITNSNRQLQALTSTVGQSKAQILAHRLKEINPNAEILAHHQLYNEQTADTLLPLDHPPSFVVDAIDNITAKCHLLNRCRKAGIPIVCSTGAGGKLDPTQIKIIDLAKTTVDPLAKAIRGILRKQYGFPEKGAFHIPAVYSTEEAKKPKATQIEPHPCEERRLILGTAAFVTATFGNICASVVIRSLIENAQSQS